jgi:hypothetical protein
MKKVIVSGLLAVIISFSATFANAGIIVLGKTETATTNNTSSTNYTAGTGDPCGEPTDGTVSLTGIIVLGVTVIIVLGADVPSDCGIIVLG